MSMGCPSSVFYGKAKPTLARHTICGGHLWIARIPRPHAAAGPGGEPPVYLDLLAGPCAVPVADVDPAGMPHLVRRPGGSPRLHLPDAHGRAGHGPRDAQRALRAEYPGVRQRLLKDRKSTRLNS